MRGTNYKFHSSGNEVSEEIRVLEERYSEWLLESLLTEELFNKACRNKQMSWKIMEEENGYVLRLGFIGENSFHPIGRPIVVFGKDEMTFVGMGLFMLYVANVVDSNNGTDLYGETKAILIKKKNKIRER